MGMHHGIVVARAAPSDLIEALNGLLPRLIVGERQGSIADLNLEDTDEGWEMAFGADDAGNTYVLDTSMVISTAGDTIVATSRVLESVVVGCGEETTSGTYWLYVADGGELRRAYWNCYSDIYRAWSKGDPLPTEPEQPLEHPDGAGMFAALRSLGFDYEAWSRRTDIRDLVYTASDLSMLGRGALADELEAFRQTVLIPDDERPKPAVVRRAEGWDVAMQPPKEKKGGLFGFLRRS
jgi:hypothetical protein